MSLGNKIEQTCPATGLKIEVDEGRCIGIGSCEVIASRDFRLNDHRVAEVMNPDDADEEAVLEAAMECPVEAITVRAADGRVLWPPY